MPDLTSYVVPPAPAVHAADLAPLRLVWTSVRNSLAIWPDYAFEVSFSHKTVLGVDTVLVNDPAGVRHVMTTNAANYVRPVMMARLMRPMLGRGLFLAEREECRRQRRMLAPAFAPGNVGLLLAHFVAAAKDLAGELEGRRSADLLDAYQAAALNAVLRALFSLAGKQERDRIGNLVRQYVIGPGRPQVLDGFARSEAAFAFALRRRRAFQRRWNAAADALVAARKDAPNAGGHRDLLDLLLAACDPETGELLNAEEVRDQAATMIFAGYETTARLLFWSSYLLTLDPCEQARLRAEVAAFPPERVVSLEDLNHWPRLLLVLLEALRLYPPVPILVREAVEDDVITGQTIRRGAQVYIAPWVLHRHRKYWQNPTAFVADRFSGRVSPWTAGGAYLPFGAGARICLGAVFALAEAQIIMATMLSRFAFRIDSKRPVMPVGRLTTQPSFAPSFGLEPAARR